MKEEDYIKRPKDQFGSLKPLWHLNLKDIDLELQPDGLRDKYIENGFHIYKSSWYDLYKVLTPDFKELYKSTDLWTDDQEEIKISRVIKCWDEDTKLIPPMLIDNAYNELVPADGKHRMKVASILDNIEIIFILFDIDLPKINEYFNPRRLN